MKRTSILPLTFLFTLGAAACGGDDGTVDATADSAPDVAADTLLNEDVSIPDASDASVADGSLDASDDVAVDAEAGADPGAPLFDTFGSFTTNIPESNDPADVYFPNPPDLDGKGYAFPIALMMQGAKVDKQYYASFGSIVARYGFVVVIPNHHIMSVAGPGLYMEPKVVNQVLAHMKNEQLGSSPVAGNLDVGNLVLLGHSYGGVVALHAIQNVCQFPFCIGGFDRPPELKGGALFGTNMRSPMGGSVAPVENQGLAVALVQGDRDSKATPEDALATYEQIKDPPRALVTIIGANHYGNCDMNNPDGADADPSMPSLAQDIAVETAARWSALFLRAHVLNDAVAHQYVHGTGDASDDNVAIAAVP